MWNDQIKLIKDEKTEKEVCICECGASEQLKHFEKCSHCHSESYHITKHEKITNEKSK